MSRGGHVAATVVSVGVYLLIGLAAPAAELWSDADGHARVALRPTLKLTALGAYDETARASSDDWQGLGLYRLRMDLNAVWSRDGGMHLAYENNGRWISEDHAEIDSGLLPVGGASAFRISDLSDEFIEADRVTCRHELDRALVYVRPAWGEITLGRQAIGLGRGRLFSAVDLFAPFAPAEVDREWRRGVDAVRVEYRYAATHSLEAIAVGGADRDNSAYLFRARGYVGNLDAELLGGRRGEDDVFAGAFSAAVRESEIHAEVAAFHAPEPHPHGGPWHDDRWIPKLVVGSSYTVNVGNGLTWLAEYHYSGFGARDIEDAVSLFSAGEYRDRYQRGDTQILGRHAVGLQCAYPFNESMTGSATLLGNPEDGSGAFNPTVRWDTSRTASLIVSAFLPWGADTRQGMLRSEYGSAATTFFLQWALYY